MKKSLHRLILALGLILALDLAPAAAERPEAIVAKGIELACLPRPPAPSRVAAAWPGAEVTQVKGLGSDDSDSAGWRMWVLLPDGGRVVMERLAPGGAVKRLLSDYSAPIPGGAARPTMMAIGGEACRIRMGRHIIRDGDGRPLRLIDLGSDLAPRALAEPVDPAPRGHARPIPDPDGPLVALVDTGVNYLSDVLSHRLAWDGANLIGYDFWDMDPRPFDYDPTRSPYHPLRQGTQVASVWLKDAPTARMAVYRYPRPDMSRLGDLVDHAAKAGVRIMLLSLGDDAAEPWAAFAEAARRHPDMLFIVPAGDQDRNLDQEPAWPAAFDLDNLLVVTAADEGGDLLPGANWGPTTVDVMTPGEMIPAMSFDERIALTTGSVYAAPRVAALAARFAAAHPDWDAAALKAAVLERADGDDDQTAYGLIAEPHREKP